MPAISIGFAVAYKATWDALTSECREALLASGQDHVSPRIAGDTGWVQDLLDEAEDNGAERRAHLWVGGRYPSNYPTELKDSARLTYQDAAALGAQLTEHSERLNLARLELNMERDTYRGPLISDRRWVNESAVEWLREVVANYSGAADLVSLGYGSTRSYYQGPEVTQRMDAYVDGHVQMAYQSSLSGITASLDKLGNWTGVKGAYCGVGRIDSEGVVVGADDAWLWLAKERYAGVDEITGYFGSGSESMFCEGHDRHRPWILQTAMLRAAAGSC